ncbi:MAG: EamA family transporter [Lachnospiraceae bacterium]|nr:EamA family transporter [Lachnospiraceae bacterium]
MTERSGFLKDRLLFVTAVVLYGTIGMFLRFTDLPSEAVALYRGVIGSVFILLYRAARHEKPDFAAIKRNLPLLLFSGFMLGLNWIFLFAAYVKTTVAIASLCNYMAPIFVIALTPLVLKEKPDPRKLPCIAAALAGIVLVSGVFGGSVGDPVGVVYGLAGAVCFTIIVFCNRVFRDLPALDRALMQLAVSAVTIFPYVLLKNGGQVPLPDPRSALIVLMLGVLQTGVAYCLYFRGMAVLPVQTVAILGYLEPVVSVLCSAVFLHEPLGLPGWIGAALVLTAALVSETAFPGPSQDAAENAPGTPAGTMENTPGTPEDAAAGTAENTPGIPAETPADTAENAPGTPEDTPADPAETAPGTPADAAGNPPDRWKRTPVRETIDE